MQKFFTPHIPEKKVCFFSIFFIIFVIAGLMICTGIIPLPVFYLLLYGINCLFWSRLLGKESIKWLFSNVTFLTFASSHLIVIGILALCTGNGVAGILGSFALCVLSLTIVSILSFLLTSVSVYRLHRISIPEAKWDSEELILFSRFIWFCTCFVLFDSIPCLFTLPTIFPALFLISSNILLIMITFLFAHHVYTIIKDSYLQDEAIRLHDEMLYQHNCTMELEQIAYLDSLTGIYTRQYALSNMGNMLRNHESFAVVFIDLDSLKQVNDQHGHLAGDEYLQRFSSQMKSCLRPNDIFARYGGDEFLILMPELDLSAANSLMKKIQKSASAPHPSGWNIPFSYGLAVSRPSDELSSEELVSMADQAMYKDKSRRKANSEGGIRS